MRGERYVENTPYVTFLYFLYVLPQYFLHCSSGLELYCCLKKCWFFKSRIPAHPALTPGRVWGGGGGMRGVVDPVVKMTNPGLHVIPTATPSYLYSPSVRRIQRLNGTPTATLHTFIHPGLFSVQRIHGLNGERLHCIPLLTQCCTVHSVQLIQGLNGERLHCISLRTQSHTAYPGAKRQTNGYTAYLYTRHTQESCKAYPRATLHKQGHISCPGLQCISKISLHVRAN